MKNRIYECVICFPLWGVALRTATWCKTSWGRGQNTTPHCNFDMYILCRSTQNTKLHFGHLNLSLVCSLPYLFAILRHVITILHFEPAGGTGCSPLWDGLRSKQPSISCNPLD